MSAQHMLEELAEHRGSGATVHPVSLNLVAFVEDSKILDWIAQRTDDIAARHASRSVLLDASQEDSGAVKGAAGKSEQIRLGVQGRSAAELRSLVHDLLVPNVQTVLLWAGPSLLDERFEVLKSLSHVIILDSSRGCAGPQALRELAEVADEQLEGTVRDLAYMRLLPWQDLIALFFDDHVLAAELPQLRGVEVAAGSEAEASYLVGWLASRLSWTPCGLHRFCNSASETVETQVSVEGEPRRVQRVTLRSAATTFSACLDEKDPALVCLRVKSRSRDDKRCAPLREVDTISLVQRAVMSGNNGAIYVETLHMVRTLLEQT